MSTVNRSNFIKDLDRSGINVNDMDAKTQEAMKKANISQKDLMENLHNKRVTRAAPAVRVS